MAPTAKDYLSVATTCLLVVGALVAMVAAVIAAGNVSCDLCASSPIVSEQVIESHSVSSVTKTDEGGTAVYHVIEQADGTDVANTYTSDMRNLEVRDDDGLGQRIDKVSVERVDLIGTRNFEEYRLYVQ